MIIAIPLFGQSVAPRFGMVDQFLIVTIAEKQVDQSKIIVIDDDAGWLDRLSELKKQNVEMLLCGGFNRQFEPLAQSLGIQVIASLTGNALELAENFARGKHLNRLCRCNNKKQNGHNFYNRRGQQQCRGGDVKN